VNGPAWNHQFSNYPPFYERYGELLVAAGTYKNAIRYREHFVPLAKAIQRFAETEK
jgi:hypothetical protein